MYSASPRWGFVEIITDEGFVGWGEPVLEGHCSAVLACVEEMKTYLIGANPMKIEDICRFTKCKNIFDFENEFNIKVRTLALDF